MDALREPFVGFRRNARVVAHDVEAAAPLDGARDQRLDGLFRGRVGLDEDGGVGFVGGVEELVTGNLSVSVCLDKGSGLVDMEVRGQDQSSPTLPAAAP